MDLPPPPPDLPPPPPVQPPRLGLPPPPPVQPPKLFGDDGPTEIFTPPPMPPPPLPPAEVDLLAIPPLPSLLPPTPTFDQPLRSSRLDPKALNESFMKLRQDERQRLNVKENPTVGGLKFQARRSPADKLAGPRVARFPTRQSLADLTSQAVPSRVLRFPRRQTVDGKKTDFVTNATTKKILKRQLPVSSPEKKPESGVGSLERRLPSASFAMKTLKRMTIKKETPLTPPSPPPVRKESIVIQDHQLPDLPAEGDEWESTNAQLSTAEPTIVSSLPPPPPPPLPPKTVSEEPVLPSARSESIWETEEDDTNRDSKHIVKSNTPPVPLGPPPELAVEKISAAPLKRPPPPPAGTGRRRVSKSHSGHPPPIAGTGHHHMKGGANQNIPPPPLPVEESDHNHATKISEEEHTPSEDTGPYCKAGSSTRTTSYPPPPPKILPLREVAADPEEAEELVFVPPQIISAQKPAVSRKNSALKPYDTRRRSQNPPPIPEPVYEETSKPPKVETPVPLKEEAPQPLKVKKDGKAEINEVLSEPIKPFHRFSILKRSSSTFRKSVSPTRKVEEVSGLVEDNDDSANTDDIFPKQDAWKGDIVRAIESSEVEDSHAPHTSYQTTPTNEEGADDSTDRVISPSLNGELLVDSVDLQKQLCRSQPRKTSRVDTLKHTFCDNDSRTNSFLFGCAFTSVRNSESLYDCILGDVPHVEEKDPIEGSVLSSTTAGSERQMVGQPANSLQEYTLIRPLPILGGFVGDKGNSTYQDLHTMLNPLLCGEEMFLLSTDIVSAYGATWRAMKCAFWLSPDLRILQWASHEKDSGVIPIENIENITTFTASSPPFSLKSGELVKGSRVLELLIRGEGEQNSITIRLALPTAYGCKVWKKALIYCMNVTAQLSGRDDMQE
jgi:hypothetical protein